MADVIQINGKGEPGQALVTEIDKAELATQVSAIVRASFKPLTDSDIRDVLRMAASQLALTSVPG